MSNIRAFADYGRRLMAECEDVSPVMKGTH